MTAKFVNLARAVIQDALPAQHAVYAGLSCLCSRPNLAIPGNKNRTYPFLYYCSSWFLIRGR
jgi:hypothetical protein